MSLHASAAVPPEKGNPVPGDGEGRASAVTAPVAASPPRLMSRVAAQKTCVFARRARFCPFGPVRDRWALRAARLVAALVAILPLPAPADEAFVTAQGADALDIIDVASMKRVATLAIGGKPAGIAVSPDGARAYVTSPEGKFLTIVDARARKVENRIPLAGGPLGVAVSPDGRRVYVADLYGKRLVEIDPDKGEGRSVGVGAMASGVAVTPDGRTILVADRDDNTLSVIDTATFERVATIPVGRHPFGVTVDAAGARAYTANVESDSVSVIDIAARKLVATLKTGSRPYTVALGKGRIFVANQHADSVSVFDVATLSPLGEVKVGEYPEGVAATRDGATILVAIWFSNELWSIDAATLEVTGKVETRDGPRAFGAFVGAAPLDSAASERHKDPQR